MSAALKGAKPRPIPTAFVWDSRRPAVDIGPKVRKTSATSRTAYAPKVFPRTAMFSATSGLSPRCIHSEFVQLASSRNIDLSFRGHELRIFDFLVWTQIATKIRETGVLRHDGTLMFGSIYFSMRILCLLVGLPVNSASYRRLEDSLEALWLAEFRVVCHTADPAHSERITNCLRMFSEIGRRDRKSDSGWQSRGVQLSLSPGIFELFAPGNFFRIDANELGALIKSPMAAWLYTHLATHTDFSKGMRYDTLQRLAGVPEMPLKEVKRVAKAAISKLQAGGHVTDVNLANPELFILRPLISMRPATKPSVRLDTTVVPPRKVAVAKKAGSRGDLDSHGEKLELAQLLDDKGRVAVHMLEWFTENDLRLMQTVFPRDEPDHPQLSRALRHVQEDLNARSGRFSD